MSGICEAMTRKGTQCKNRATTGAVCCKTHTPAPASASAPASAPTPAPSPVVDPYTFEALKDRLEAFLACCRQVIAFKAKYGVRGVRMPIMDEDISENIVKFIIQYMLGDRTCAWTKSIAKENSKIAGDLTSATAGAIECKCFTSDGPISFGPTEKWNEIYFLDARAVLDGRIVVWRVPLANTAPEWRAVKINKAQTFADQCEQARRPRIVWESLFPQIEENAIKVFEGTMDDVFGLNAPPAPAPAPASAEPCGGAGASAPGAEPSLE